MSRKTRMLLLIFVVASLALGALFVAAPAGASLAQESGGDRIASLGGDYDVIAQVTVDPNAPKRTFEETEETPWTLWMPKALAPAVFGLLVFVVAWYVWKVIRVRPPRA